MKRYILIAGPNGAGKTSLSSSLSQLAELDYLNLDTIAREKGTGLIKAAEDIFREVDQNFCQGKSFAQETTLTGKTIRGNLERARNAGYEIVIHYVAVENVKLCKERIAHRVAVGGHGIPEADIERRYNESLRAVKEIMPLCDELYFYDNTKLFRQIAIVKKGKVLWKSNSIPKWLKKIF